jgi:septum formation protein
MTAMPTSKPTFVYLASASPRRSQLLDQLGQAHRPLVADATEDAESLEAERAGESPADYVQRVCHSKLQAAQARLKRRGLPSAPILVADTTVAVGRCILGKPRDKAEAMTILQALSGRSHRVLTAVAVASGRRSFAALSLSQVRLAELTPAMIRSYIASGEPWGKAGAYAVQGRMAAYIERLQGSYSGIMGLPLFETRLLLAQVGLHTPQHAPTNP